METEVKKVEEDLESEEKLKESEEIIPQEFTVKHPLQNTWTLWFFENDKSKAWEENQRQIISFDTIEDFWSIYNHIKTASELRSGCDYSLFKGDIRPMWEDSANRKGGRWLINVEKRQRGDLDKYWLDLMLLMIGEGFDKNSDEVRGAVVNVRPKMDKIAVWTADASRTTANVDIGVKVKEQLGAGKLDYQSHKEVSCKTGSMVKTLLTL